MNKKRFAHLQSGITIIEIIIYFGLLSIFLTSIVGIFTSALNLKLENEATSAIFQDARYIFSKLNYQNIKENNLDLVNGKLLLNNISLNGTDTVISNLDIVDVGNVGGKPTVQISFDISSNITEGGINRTKHIQTTYGTR